MSFARPLVCVEVDAHLGRVVEVVRRVFISLPFLQAHETELIEWGRYKRRSGWITLKRVFRNQCFITFSAKPDLRDISFICCSEGELLMSKYWRSTLSWSSLMRVLALLAGEELAAATAAAAASACGLADMKLPMRSEERKWEGPRKGFIPPRNMFSREKFTSVVDPGSSSVFSSLLGFFSRGSSSSTVSSFSSCLISSGFITAVPSSASSQAKVAALSLSMNSC